MPLEFSHFVIKNKSGKWHLLTDLQKVNASMKPIGALQPGIPSPTTIPQNWHIIIIDLQDCFFTIPLHPLDQERFAFSLPYPNHVGPHKRYQWSVLPQGMMNSPTICQYYIAKALEPMKKQFPDFLVIRYVDDILFSAPSVLETQQKFDIAQQCLRASGLIIAPEKIQTSTPYHYLGFIVNRQCITPQLTQIRVDKLSTLNDFQKLLGDINWIRSSLGTANYQLTNLFNILKGDPDLNCPRSVSQEAREELCLVQNKLQKQFLTHIRLELPLQLFILPSLHSLTGLLTQQEYPIEWIYTRFRGMRSLTPYLDLIVPVIINGRSRAGL